LGAGTEAYLGYRVLFLGDQDAAFALATGYQLTNYSGSALVYLFQQGPKSIAQIYNNYKYFRAINRAINISKSMLGKTPEELAELIARNNWASPKNAPYRTTDQWKTYEILDSDLKIEIRMHEGLIEKYEFGWLGRVSLNAKSMEFFPPEVRHLVARPGQYSTDYQLYIDPLVGGPVPPDEKAGHFLLSELITLVNGRGWFERVFSIFGQ
jgi:hypothetical protein